MTAKQTVYQHLTDLGITFDTVDHPEVFTIEAMSQLGFPENVTIAKNLFLRNAKGNQHYLLVVAGEQSIDLKAIKELIGSTKLSFASEDRLKKHLGLSKGAVSPFGLLNDTEQHVQVFLDQQLDSPQLIGVHPNDNSATVFISYSDLVTSIKASGHTPKHLVF